MSVGRTLRRTHREKVKDGTPGTVRLWLFDCPPIDVHAHLYLNGHLALHHEIRDGKVLNTRTLVISHVRTGLLVFTVCKGKAVALKVVAALAQAGEEAWDFGVWGENCLLADQPRVREAMDAAMVVMHGEGWRERYTAKTGWVVYAGS